MARMLRVALRPYFLGLLALMVVATLVCGLLATWQWDRAHRAMSDQAAGAQELGDIREVVDIGGAVTNEIVGDIVTATGQFDAEEQIIVPGRSIDGQDAVIIVAALHVPLEDGTDALLPVARGWVAADAVTGPDGELDPSLAPPVPEGDVVVSGRLEASEAAAGGIEDGVAGEIATPLLVNVWGSPMYSGYLADVDPIDGLNPMPEAQSAFSKGLNWQNIGYSMQWVLFGAFFLYLWWRSVRSVHLDELEDQREAMLESLEGGPAAASDETSSEGTSSDEPSLTENSSAEGAALRGPSALSSATLGSSASSSSNPSSSTPASSQAAPASGKDV